MKPFDIHCVLKLFGIALPHNSIWKWACTSFDNNLCRAQFRLHKEVFVHSEPLFWMRSDHSFALEEVDVAGGHLFFSGLVLWSLKPNFISRLDILSSFLAWLHKLITSSRTFIPLQYTFWFYQSLSLWLVWIHCTLFKLLLLKDIILYKLLIFHNLSLLLMLQIALEVSILHNINILDIRIHARIVEILRENYHIAAFVVVAFHI